MALSHSINFDGNASLDVAPHQLTHTSWPVAPPHESSTRRQEAVRVGRRTDGPPLQQRRPLHLRALRQRVKAVVDAADPVGLLEMGAPDDEYDSEIDDFVRLVSRTDFVTAEDVIGTWEKWFYPGISGTDPVAAAALARALDAVRYA